MSVDEQAETVTPESNPEAFQKADYQQAIHKLCDEFNVPPPPGREYKASDVIQHVINVTGHTISLLGLLQIAHMTGASIQLYVTDHDELDKPVALE